MARAKASPARGGKVDGAGPRRQAREAALQMLYGLDLTAAADTASVDRAVRDYWAHLEGPAAGRAYADEIVHAVVERREALDAAIRGANPTWRIERMARVDLSVLRIGAYEITARDDVPAQIAIDEAVELAKRYGTDESPAFVNGVLDRVARNHQKL